MTLQSAETAAAAVTKEKAVFKGEFTRLLSQAHESNLVHTFTLRVWPCQACVWPQAQQPAWHLL